jgi:hypothetical protein
MSSFLIPGEREDIGPPHFFEQGPTFVNPAPNGVGASAVHPPFGDCCYSQCSMVNGYFAKKVKICVQLFVYLTLNEMTFVFTVEKKLVL